MRTQLILLALMFASVSALTGNMCACNQLLSQADCTAGGCTWANSACADSTAAAVTCTKTTQAECDAIAGCAWTTGTTGACAAFTKCADYSVSTATMCYSKDVTCSPGTTAGTTTPCVTQDVTKCTTITDQTTCTTLACNWTTKCEAKTCASINGNATCTAVRADDITKVQICIWNNACADATDVATLTSATCFTNSGSSYTWNGTTCTACAASSTTPASNAWLLSFIGLLAMLMF